MLTLGLMALAHIKNPEQLTQCKPGEPSRIIGLDSIPEVSCLWGKIKLLIKQVYHCHGDIEPDLTNLTLNITLHFLSAPRFNEAATKLAELLTNTETIFPETGLRIIFKTHAEQTAKGKEF